MRLLLTLCLLALMAGNFCCSFKETPEAKFVMYTLIEIRVQNRLGMPQEIQIWRTNEGIRLWVAVVPGNNYKVGDRLPAPYKL